MSLGMFKDFLSQILTLLSYIHSKNILHGDIKSENIVASPNDPDEVSQGRAPVYTYRLSTFFERRLLAT